MGETPKITERIPTDRPVQDVVDLPRIQALRPSRHLPRVT